MLYCYLAEEQISPHMRSGRDGGGETSTEEGSLMGLGSEMDD
jgi:hypothetical protein